MRSPFNRVVAIMPVAAIAGEVILTTVGITKLWEASPTPMGIQSSGRRQSATESPPTRRRTPPAAHPTPATLVTWAAID
jgi:hypothetical protein